MTGTGKNGPAMIVWCRTNDFVFPNERVARIHGLKNVGCADLYGLSCVGAKFVLDVLGNVRDIGSAEQKAGVPAVIHNDSTVFARAAKTTVREQS
jgi:hypothetical protein